MSLVSNLAPSPVTHTSSRLLEFEILRDLLAGYARRPWASAGSANFCLPLDRSWIANQHQLTTEIREYRRVGGRFEFAGLPEVRKLIEKSGSAEQRLKPRKSAT